MTVHNIWPSSTAPILLHLVLTPTPNDAGFGNPAICNCFYHASDWVSCSSKFQHRHNSYLVRTNTVALRLALGLAGEGQGYGKDCMVLFLYNSI